eukprot:3978-Heterococcus_DN1.PRE.4
MRRSSLSCSASHNMVCANGYSHQNGYRPVKQRAGVRCRSRSATGSLLQQVNTCCSSYRAAATAVAAGSASAARTHLHCTEIFFD